MPFVALPCARASSDRHRKRSSSPHFCNHLLSLPHSLCIVHPTNNLPPKVWSILSSTMSCSTFIYHRGMSSPCCMHAIFNIYYWVWEHSLFVHLFGMLWLTVLFCVQWYTVTFQVQTADRGGIYAHINSFECFSAIAEWLISCINREKEYINQSEGFFWCILNINKLQVFMLFEQRALLTAVTLLLKFHGSHLSCGRRVT